MSGVAYPRDAYPSWTPATAYALRARVIPQPTNGKTRWPAWYECISAGTSGPTEPAFPDDQDTGAQTPDGSITWRCGGYAGNDPQWAPGVAVPTGTIITPDLPTQWAPNRPYRLGDSVLPSLPVPDYDLLRSCEWSANAGRVFFVSAVSGAGVSGPLQPVWNASGSTVDGEVTWSSTGAGPAIRVFFQATVGGITGSARPVWQVPKGSTTTDGGVTWTSIGGEQDRILLAYGL